MTIGQWLSRAPSLAVAALVLVARPTPAQPDQAQPQPGQPIGLFNGRDLTGWRVLSTGDDARRGSFAIDTAANPPEIVGTSAEDTENTFLATTATYRDFILEFEVKLDPGINSGVQFRSLSSPDHQSGRVHGYQYEIEDSARAWAAGIYDEARRGWLYPVDLNPPAKAAFRPGEWNRATILCAGTTIRTTLNGQPVSHLVDDLTAEGFIALQVHGIGKGQPGAGRTVRWRNLRLVPLDRAAAERYRDLPPDAWHDVFIRNTIPNHLSDAERAQGWRLLFDGTSTDAWRGAHKDDFPTDPAGRGWIVRDGQLIIQKASGGESTNAGDLVTRDEFSAFEFQFEFMPAQGANSGIKYFVTENFATTGSAIGLEYQILDDERHPDAKMGKNGNRTLASLYDLIPSAREVSTRPVPRRIDDWNHGRIVVPPTNAVEHWLNGFRVLTYQRGSPEFLALVADSKYKAYANFGLAERGHLLLQDHGDEVRFRSLKVRELTHR